MFMAPDTLPSVLYPVLALSEHDPRQAVAQAQALLPQTPADDAAFYAWGCYTFGWCWLRWERLPAARQWLMQAQATWMLQGNAGSVLTCRRALLMVEALGGAGAGLQDSWNVLVADYIAAGQPLEAARTRIQQIEHLNLLVLPQAARTLVDRIVPTIQAQGSLDDQALLLRAEASIASDLGHLEPALAQISRAAELFAAAGSPLEVAKCRRRRAWLWQRLEQFAQAMDDLQQAKATFQQLDLPIERALCQRNEATIAGYRGDYARALVEIHQARAALAALGRRDAVADCDLTLGNVAYYSAQYDLALAWYRQAQAVYTDLGSQYLACVSRRNQALVLRARGEPQPAFALLTLIESAVRALGDAGEEAEIVLLQGLALNDMAEEARALDYLLQAQAQFLALENQRGAARARLEQGYIYLAQQRPDLAAPCFHQAHAVLAERPIHSWRIAYGLGRCAYLQGDPPAALRQYQAASSIIAGLRRTLASEHASSGLFSLAQQMFGDALTLAAAQDDLPALVALAEQQRALALQRQCARVALHMPPDMHARYAQSSEQLRQVIAHDAPAQARDAALSAYMQVLLQVRHTTATLPTLTPDPPDLAQLRVALGAAYPDGWAVLLYVRCGDRLFIVTFDAQRLTLEQTPCDAQLDALVERACRRKYTEYIYRDIARLYDPTTPPWQVPTALAARLIPGALRARLHPAMRLLIVPSAPLHALPWAALRIDDAWLCERATLQILPALALWEPLAARAVESNDALLIGCSQFGARAQPLPNMAAEQELVTRLWPGRCTCLTDAAATRSALLELAAQADLQRYRLLHITSHARLVDARGLLAHVKLWDSDLLLDEIAGLGLAGALVVLAACDGAAGEVLPGDEVLSLSHAFLAGGARDVIAGIWPFFDLGTHDLLELVYTELARAQDAPTALAQAQRAWIARYAHLDDQRPVAYSPVVWGGLLAIGAGT
jgi:tetratricopeptide (TPR) repeat protein